MDIERLREAFLRGAGKRPAGTTGPPAEKIWEAAGGRLPPDEFARVLDAALADPASAELWAIARRLLADDADTGAASGHETAAPGTAWRILWRVAAVVILAAGLTTIWLVYRSPGDPVYRGGERTIDSRMPADAVISRADAVLRWEPVAGARRYNLRLLDAGYRVLHVEDGLTSPSYVIPTDVLAAIPDGGTLLWQVEAVLPDGTSVLSETFRVNVSGIGGEAPPEEN